MKTEQQIKDQLTKITEQLEKMREHIEKIQATGIDTRDLYQWATCIESGKEALKWVLADDSYANIVY